ncbi:hypothetical protein ACHAXH_009688 [Discostella pseudostelligera]
MSTTNLMQRRHQRKKAFADATAGVIGSLAAMLVFYPVDVWKTSLQANANASADVGNDNDGDAATATNNDGLLKARNISYSSSSSSKSNEKIDSTKILSAVSTATMTTTLTRLFRGLPYKIAHTIASSFTYCKNSKRRPSHTQQQQPIQQNQRQQAQKQMQSILSLWNGLLPALMLCTNPAIQYTLYDTFKATWLVRRRYKVQSGQLRQTQPRQPHGKSSGQSLSSSNNPKRRQHSLTMSEAFACGMISKFIATMITYPLIRCKVMLMVSAAPNITTTASTSSCTSRTSTFFKGDVERIHPTENGLRVVDEDGCNNDNKICNGTETISEVQRKHSRAVPVGTKHAMSNNANSSLSSSSSSKGIHKYPYPHSLPLLLLHIHKYDGGIRGWYRGCSLQLLHTVLKSALLMMVRERIAYATHRFFRIEE